MKEGWFEGADGTQLYYRVMGDGEIPLVLNDGIGCEGYAWKYFIPYFEKNYKIVHWNYKGHGRSDMPRTMDHLGIEDSCHDLAKLFDFLDLPPVVMVGHSMGVQVVFEMAHLYPEKVCGLVPICGSYGNPLDTFHDNKLLKTVFPYLKSAIDSHTDVLQKVWTIITTSELAYQIAVHMEVNGKLVNRNDFTPYFEHIGKMDVNLFASMLAAAQQHSAKPHLPNIKVPVVIIGGERDTFTPMWLSHEMQGLIPGGELLMIPGGSHTAPIEMPEYIHLRIEKFLNERVRPRVETIAAKTAKKTTKKTTRKSSAKAKTTGTKKTKAASKKKSTKAAAVKSTDSKSAPVEKVAKA